MEVLILVILAFLILALGAALYFSQVIMFYYHYPPSTPEAGLIVREDDEYAKRVWKGFVHNPKKDLGYDYEDVSFTTREGLTLRGWYVPASSAGERGVVLVHGAGVDRRAMQKHVSYLHRAGFYVLLFDLRNHGISDNNGRGLSFGLYEGYDIEAAVEYLKNQKGIKRAGVLGTSMGAVSAIYAASRNPAIDAALLENPYSDLYLLICGRPKVKHVPRFYVDFVLYIVSKRMGVNTKGIRPVDVISAISPRPVFLIHGTGDRGVSYKHSERLFGVALEPKELWVVPGGEHERIWNLVPLEYERRVLDFFNRYL